MKHSAYLFLMIGLSIPCLISDCTNVGKCEVGSKNCLCGDNDLCSADLSCVKDAPEALTEEMKEKGICLHVTCVNTCDEANDDSCDDGGENSDSEKCNWGSDCADCGKRFGKPPGNARCSNTCSSADDRSCDDGGEGSRYTNCKWGTDCIDCGPRYGSPPICLNTCSSKSDGVCDDGGKGSTFSRCDWGTDCDDCNPRYGDPP